MEIRWFQNRYTELTYLYRNGKDLLGETISKYVERTELLKNDIGRGQVTLRIFKVTAADDGPYHCFFKDGKFYEEHITVVKVIGRHEFLCNCCVLTIPRLYSMELMENSEGLTIIA